MGEALRVGTKRKIGVGFVPFCDIIKTMPRLRGGNNNELNSEARPLFISVSDLQPTTNNPQQKGDLPVVSRQSLVISHTGYAPNTTIPAK